MGCLRVKLVEVPSVGPVLAPERIVPAQPLQQVVPQTADQRIRPGGAGERLGQFGHLDDPAVDSNGCVHLPPDAAKRYWDNVQVGDKVFIY